MFKNYLKIALRTLVKNKVYALINVSGLAVGMANAWPIAYFGANAWLQKFAYRIEPGWTTFLFAGVLALATALLTVSWQAIRSALANPVKALQYE